MGATPVHNSVCHLSMPSAANTECLIHYGWTDKALHGVRVGKQIVF